MLEMIPQEFDVKLISQNEGGALFAACRPDVWHFVLATTKWSVSNYQSIDIGQFHWPRYSVARALASGGMGVPPLVRQLGMQLDQDSVSVSVRDRVFRLSPTIVKEMKKDLASLERAMTKVRATAEGFEVIDAETSRGFSVVAEQRCLAEAIAFEWEVRGHLDYANFAVYSAFCTWRDFICDDPTKAADIARGMAEEMISWDPTRIGDDPYWESVFQIQERLWGTRLWGPGIDAEEDVLRDILLRAFGKLSSIQFAQFVLMNGMHRGGPFHAFATLFGIIDFDGYKYWRTREFQPDSPEEQEIRTHSSFIELLGVRDDDERIN